MKWREIPMPAREPCSHWTSYAHPVQKRTTYADPSVLSSRFQMPLPELEAEAPVRLELSATVLDAASNVIQYVEHTEPPAEIERTEWLCELGRRDTASTRCGRDEDIYPRQGFPGDMSAPQLIYNLSALARAPGKNTNRKTNRKTDKTVDREAIRKTERTPDRRTDRKTCRKKSRETDRKPHSRTDVVNHLARQEKQQEDSQQQKSHVHSHRC